MAALSHLDPDFGSVVAIEAVNEPIMDASQTPGYGGCKSLLKFQRFGFDHKYLTQSRRTS